MGTTLDSESGNPFEAGPQRVEVSINGVSVGSVLLVFNHPRNVRTSVVSFLQELLEIEFAARRNAGLDR